MKFCKYCGSEMFGEFETNAKNNHQFKAFYTCFKCNALCDGEYLENKKGKRTISEKWWNPDTKEFEKGGD